MVVDLRPATGAVVTLARILWGGARSSPACATCVQMRSVRALNHQFETVRVFWHCLFVFVFLVKRAFINCLLGVIGRSLRGVVE